MQFDYKNIKQYKFQIFYSYNYSCFDYVHYIFMLMYTTNKTRKSATRKEAIENYKLKTAGRDNFSQRHLYTIYI